MFTDRTGELPRELAGVALRDWVILQVVLSGH